MIKPLNGNILVMPRRNQTEKIFQEDDSRRDLQYAIVKALPPEEIIVVDEKGDPAPLQIEDMVVYNPRNMTKIVYGDDVYGVVHNLTLVAVV